MEVELSAMITKETDLQPHFRKDDEISVDNRLKGNACFRAGNYSMAMAFYNDSLRFVESGSEQLMSLAYANRSTCFFAIENV